MPSAIAWCWSCAFGVALAIDNGIGLTPPRGWRSWNAFDCMQNSSILTQAHMQMQMVAATTPRLVDGKQTSLAELGFDWISMDDGWQQCNCSTRQDVDPKLPQCPNLCFGGHCTFHDGDGKPMVRHDRFPDMQALVDYGHSLGLKVGTYLNNCICMEAGSSTTHYEEDVKWMIGLGFDGVKIDGCSNAKNVSRWAELFNATKKPIRIENCHNGWPDFKTGYCPMNFFRTGGDISADMGSIITEAYSTVSAADLPQPRSRPGCWAYPDMSEIGNFPDGPSQLDQERSHWSLWCVISSPLILGFDMNNSAKMDRVWPIITNKEALRISESWFGHPGTMIRAYAADASQGFQLAQTSCDGQPETLGWHILDGKLLHGDDSECVLSEGLSCPPPTTWSQDVQCGLRMAACPANKARWQLNGSLLQYFDGNPKDGPQCLSAHKSVLDVNKDYYSRQPAAAKLEGCPNHPEAASPQAFQLSDRGELRSLSLGTCLAKLPVHGIQMWAKPLGANEVAVLLLNPSGQNQTLSFPLIDTPAFHGTHVDCLRGNVPSCIAKDVWTAQNLPQDFGHVNASLRPHASMFFVVSEAAEELHI